MMTILQWITINNTLSAGIEPHSERPTIQLAGSIFCQSEKKFVATTENNKSRFPKTSPPHCLCERSEKYHYLCEPCTLRTAVRMTRTRSWSAVQRPFLKMAVAVLLVRTVYQQLTSQAVRIYSPDVHWKYIIGIIFSIFIELNILLVSDNSSLW